MARIRTVKPEFFTHEGIFDAEEQTGLPLRIAFIGLWCIADREGKFRWEPRRIGVQILPYDKVSFADILNALHKHGFIIRSGCGSYGKIPSFLEHQCPNIRECKSAIPDDVFSVQADASTCMHVQADACILGREGKGREEEREGNGKEQEGERGRIAAASPHVSESPKRTRRPSVAIDRPDDIAEAHWRDWTACRRKPVTESVLVRIRREAGKAGISADEAIRTAAERQWEGFQSEWLSSDLTATERKPSQPMTFTQIREKNTDDVFDRVFGPRTIADDPIGIRSSVCDPQNGADRKDA